MKNPYFKIIALTFILALTFFLTACMDTKYSDIEMVHINAGTFTMGSDDTTDVDAQPAHTVTLTKGFYMSKYQVTQRQYEEVMGSNPSFFIGSDNMPVESVNWYEAIVFCNRLSIQEGLVPVYIISGSFDPDNWGTIPTLTGTAWDDVIMAKGANGYRLPTEAEWEYACRAGTTTAYNTGDIIDDNNTGWYAINSTSMPYEVGKKPANAWGLYDMHGNVSEWCWDWNDPGYYSSSPSLDPTGPATAGSNRRVLRGGSFDSYAPDLRSAYRNSSAPSVRYSNSGFRLVRP